MASRILLHSGDPCLTERLSEAGVEMYRAANIGVAFVQAAGGGFSLIVLDVEASLDDALEFCRCLRARGIRTPILLLASAWDLADKSRAIHAGADECFEESAELIARIDALVCRSDAAEFSAPGAYCFGEVSVDSAGQVIRNGASVSLSVKERQLLRYLIEKRGAVVSREELLSVVWGYRAIVTRTVDVHIAALRHKLEAVPHNPRFIRTVRGKGYLFREGAKP